MARTNTKIHSTHRTHENAPARHLSAEAELRRSVLACMLWEQTFYEGGKSIADRITGLVERVNGDVVAKLAIEARETHKLRHVPLWLVRCLSQKRYPVADVLARVIQRPDELTEFLSLYWKDGRCPISRQVKLGLARSFTKFDAYQLAKYDRPGAVRLRDVLFMCHAKPKDAEQAATWKQLIDGSLPSPDTWEVSLSSGADKRETFTRLLTEGQMGGLALLRNLRNMIESGVSDSLIREAISTNTFKHVLPFRFVAAARYAPQLEDSLEVAMFKAIENMPKLQGKTALVVDHSDSMNMALSERSDMSRFDAAAALAMLLREICVDVVTVVFSAAAIQHTEYRQSRHRNADKDAVVVPPRRGFALRDAMAEALPWFGTNTESGKKLADTAGYDRIILITDEQSHQAISAPHGTGYCVNVANYKNGIGYGSWTHIDGWSDSVVGYIGAVERDTTR